MPITLKALPAAPPELLPSYGRSLVILRRAASPPKDLTKACSRDAFDGTRYTASAMGVPSGATGAACRRTVPRTGFAAARDDRAKSVTHNVGMTLRRLKTYAGAQGYVYQYYFVGKRAALADDPQAPATEFIFDVTSDRKLTYAVSVFLPESPLAVWNLAHGRPPNDAEQYAAVKLRLFRAFDEIEDMKAAGRRLTIDAALLEEALASLGVE